MHSSALVKPKTRTMPDWVTQQNNHLGASYPLPPPPPPPEPIEKFSNHSPVEPDYEVIDFSQQQNSSRTSSANSDSKRKCTLCGSPNPLLNCNECAQQLFCVSCDEMFHKHPKRQHHIRKVIDLNKPSLPPKMGSNPNAATPPMAPPRRHKRGDFLTPLLRRKQRDQVNETRGSFTVSASPTPSLTNSTWDERMDTLKRSFLMNRPLPDTPKTQAHNRQEEQFSRSTTPKSVFDNIQRPPSVTLERIKSKANATFDRMQALQQRYREQREQMGRERSLSVSRQNHRAFDQWSNISSSPNHLRTASISSGTNTSHLNLPFHNHHQRFGGEQQMQQEQQQQLHNASTKMNHPQSKGLSTSVFNLHRMPTADNTWMKNTMQQVQSMAYLNCSNNNNNNNNNSGHVPWQSPPNTPISPEPWHNQVNAYPMQHWNCSNLSLNIPPGYVLQPAPAKMYPPPMMMHPQRGYPSNMYPNPYMEAAMPVLTTGLPPAFSRPVSRMVSPACSRKSITLRRKHRPNYLPDQPTDDEDSEFDDHRSMISNRSDLSKLHRRRLSNTSQSYCENDSNFTNQGNQYKGSKGHRRDSSTKSVHSGWTAGSRMPSNNARSTDSTVNSSQISSRIYSDIDSSGSGTRALIQAKIQEKLNEEDNLKLRKNKSKTKLTKSTKIPVRHVEKQTIAVQTPALKTVKSHESNGTSRSESEDEPTQIPHKEKEVSRQANETKQQPTKPEPAEAEQEAGEPEQITVDTLGPPPSTPKHEWECEFCTFVNKPNTKICSICCKTPTQQPKPPTDSKSPAESGNAATLTTASTTKNLQTNNVTPFLDQTKSPTTRPITSKRLNSSDMRESVSEKETLDDVWGNLDKSIQAKADEIKSKSKAENENRNVQINLDKFGAKVGREIGTSPPPQHISTQTYDVLPLNDLKKTQDNTKLNKIIPTKSVFDEHIEESDLYKYTSEELNAALKYSGSDIHPLLWLRDHWPKLITTVQTLATKYGQEHAQNTIGTISRLEARNALRLHTGNVWQAVSECIEQRQSKYREISKSGNFSREDIVTALTIHQGDVKQALIDLERSQTKPFLMRIRGSPCGTENESSTIPNLLETNKSPNSSNSSQTATNYHIDPDINDFLRANVSDCMQLLNANNAYNPNDQKQSLYYHLTPNCSNMDKLMLTSDTTISNSSETQTGDNNHDNSVSEAIGDSIANNKHMLKDLEILIDNLEQQQAKQKQKEDNTNPEQHPSPYDLENIRIFTKSPIAATKFKKGRIQNQNDSQNLNIKYFIRQHIQEILPNLVQQVELELMDNKEEEGVEESQPVVDRIEKDNIADTQLTQTPAVPPPPDPEEYIMAELINPNIVYGRNREEVPPSYLYASEIAPFRIEYDKGTQKVHEHIYQLSSLENAIRVIYKMLLSKQNSTPTNQAIETRDLNKSSKSTVFQKSSKPSQSNVIKSKSAATLNARHPTTKKEVSSLTPELQRQNSVKSLDMITTNQKSIPKKSKIPVRSIKSHRNSHNRRETLETVNKTNSITSLNSNSDFKNKDVTLKNETKDTTEAEHNLERNTTVNSDVSSIDDLYQNEDNQSLTSTSEIFLMMQPSHHHSGDIGSSHTNLSTNSSIMQSAKSDITPDKTQSNKDQPKQNLSDLVKDTQKIIQQMRDEINIDEFESTEGSDNDTDEYYDESYNHSSSGSEEEYVEEEEVDEEEGEEEEEEDVEFEDEDDDADNNVDEKEKEEEIELISNELNSVQTTEEEDIIHNSAITNTATVTNDSTKTDAINQSNMENLNTSEGPNLANNDVTNILKVEAIEPLSLNNNNLQIELNQSENTVNHENNVQPHSSIQSIQTTTSEGITSKHNPLEETPTTSTSIAKVNEQSIGSTSKPKSETPSTSPKNRSKLNSLTGNLNNLGVMPEKSTPSIKETITEIQLKQGINDSNLPTNSHVVANSESLQSGNLEPIKNLEITTGDLPSISTSLTKATPIVSNKTESVPTVTKKTSADSKIPKFKEQTTSPQKGLKKKSNALSKSFVTQRPPPIGINSVKSLRQELLKQSQPSNPGPKKANPPPLLQRKNSINEVINKLTKSNDVQTEIYKVFKSRVQPRLPNKKYHETCFSDDDYESPEEDTVYDLSQRKFSVPVFRTYPNLPTNEECELTELTDKLLKEKLLSTEAEAQIAASLIQMKFQKDVAVWAAKECSDLDHAISLLQQECELCNGIYSLNEIVSMLKCTHKCCRNCAKKYFTVQITERNINDCNCPYCKLPELHNQNEHEDENLEYFSNLDILLKNILDAEVHELFQRKLRDRTLLKDPNFKWCVQCSSGFFARPKQKRLICPDCGSITCALCRKPWQKQHETLTCDKFLEWQLANDPEVQALGVQKHLEQNGIKCPNCNFRYSLARGGCMHFTCTQCKFEFCYGCSRPFMMGAKCDVSPYCAKLGLHAHHPRNCLFYLRDKLPIQLQNLLKNNGVDYRLEPLANMGVELANNQGSKTSSYLQRCPVPIQKETPTGLVDTKCNGDVPAEHGGLCRIHYVEYLTAIVAKANIDPLPIFDLTDCVQELRRRGIALPERGPWDTDEIYKNMCAEVIKQNIPLDAI